MDLFLAVTIAPDAQSLEAQLPMLYTVVWLSSLNHPTMQHDTSIHTGPWGTWHNESDEIIGSVTTFNAHEAKAMLSASIVPISHSPRSTEILHK